MVARHGSRKSRWGQSVVSRLGPCRKMKRRGVDALPGQCRTINMPNRARSPKAEATCLYEHGVSGHVADMPFHLRGTRHYQQNYTNTPPRETETSGQHSPDPNTQCGLMCEGASVNRGAPSCYASAVGIHGAFEGSHTSTTSTICFGISAVALGWGQRASAMRVEPEPEMAMSVKPAARSLSAMVSLLAKRSIHPREILAL